MTHEFTFEIAEAPDGRTKNGDPHYVAMFDRHGRYAMRMAGGQMWATFLMVAAALAEYDKHRKASNSIHVIGKGCWVLPVDHDGG